MEGYKTRVDVAKIEGAGRVYAAAYAAYLQSGGLSAPALVGARATAQLAADDFLRNMNAQFD